LGLSRRRVGAWAGERATKKPRPASPLTGFLRGDRCWNLGTLWRESSCPRRKHDVQTFAASRKREAPPGAFPRGFPRGQMGLLGGHHFSLGDQQRTRSPRSQDVEEQEPHSPWRERAGLLRKRRPEASLVPGSTREMPKSVAAGVREEGSYLIRRLSRFRTPALRPSSVLWKAPAAITL
jgi:hypothetical protein